MNTFGNFGTPPKTNNHLTATDIIPHGIPPSDFWLRENGKPYKYPSGKNVGKTLPCTLIWCIHNANASHAAPSRRFKIDQRTIKQFSKDSNCSEEYLIWSVCTNSELKDTPFHDHCLTEAIEKNMTAVLSALGIAPNPAPSELDIVLQVLKDNGTSDEVVSAVLTEITTNKKLRDEIRTLLDKAEL